MGLRGPLHRVIAGIDPRHRRDRAELSDGGVSDLRVVDDVGIVAHRHFMQDRARADLAIGAEPCVVQGRGGSMVGSTESILPAMRIPQR